MTVTIFPWCRCSCESVTFLALWSSDWEEPSFYMYALVLRTRMNWLCCVSNWVLAEINMLRFVITFRNETKNWLTQTILLEDSDLLISSPVSGDDKVSQRRVIAACHCHIALWVGVMGWCIVSWYVNLGLPRMCSAVRQLFHFMKRRQ